LERVQGQPAAGVEFVRGEEMNEWRIPPEDVCKIVMGWWWWSVVGGT